MKVKESGWMGQKKGQSDTLGVAVLIIVMAIILIIYIILLPADERARLFNSTAGFVFLAFKKVRNFFS